MSTIRESDAADELARRNTRPHSRDRGAILATLNPSFVVVYDPDAAFIREIETHKASRPGAPMRVYFLVHDTSLEEQRYLSSVRYETEAFDALIRAKQHMAMPAEQEGSTARGWRIRTPDADETSSTSGGGASARLAPRIVDWMDRCRSLCRRALSLAPAALLCRSWRRSADSARDAAALTRVAAEGSSRRLPRRVWWWTCASS